MLLGQLAQRRPTDPEQVYAYGLYLSGSERERAALTHLNTLPRDKWTPNILELAQRLQTNELMATANRLRDNGQEAQAVALLRQQPAPAGKRSGRRRTAPRGRYAAGATGPAQADRP